MMKSRPIVTVVASLLAAGAVSAQGTASPAGPPTAMQARADLPLQPGEVVIPFANGCGAISSGKNLDADRKTFAAFNWIGTCRLGLAHGEGLAQRIDGSSATRQRYQYGVMLGMRDGASPYWARGNSGFFLVTIREDGLHDYVVAGSPDVDAATLTAAYAITVDVADGVGRAIDVFRPVALECSNDGKVNWKGVTVSAAEAVDANADCERYWVKNGGTRRVSMFYNLSLDVAYIEHSHWTRTIGGGDSTKEISARYCSGGSNSADCTRVLQELLQPYAARIQAIIDGQRRQYANGLPWLTARYAPLEADRRQRWLALASRYSAAPSSARPLTSPVRPAAASPAGKGDRR